MNLGVRVGVIDHKGCGQGEEDMDLASGEAVDGVLDRINFLPILR